MRVLITLLFLIAVFTVHAQTTFYSQINHAGYSTTLKKLSDGNLLSANSDNYTVEVIKTDTNGLFIWQSTLPAPWTEVIEVEEAADGGIFVLMYGPYQQNRCAYVLRLKSNGLLDWHQGYHHLSNDYFLDIQAMPDTGFMVIGNGCSAAGAQLVRCKKTGSIAWDKTYIDANGKYFGFTQFVLVNNGTELLFSGYTVAPAVDEDLLVAKMDTAGNLLWLKEYPLAGSFDVPMAITETPTGFAVAFFYQYPLP
ncbi:MAG TPA: hypothetical protein VK826_04215, partial [Bacteroidia bacterium]|nr:hypothetical protein [Bacteroidia bacterium]